MSHDKDNDRWVMVNFGLFLELLNRIFDAIEINWKNHLARFFFEKWFHEMLKILFRKQPDNTRVPNWNSDQSEKINMDPYWRILENLYRFFFEILVFRVMSRTVSLENHPNIIFWQNALPIYWQPSGLMPCLFSNHNKSGVRLPDWESSPYYFMWNPNEITIGKTHSHLVTRF